MLSLVGVGLLGALPALADDNASVDPNRDHHRRRERNTRLECRFIAPAFAFKGKTGITQCFAQARIREFRDRDRDHGDHRPSSTGGASALNDWDTDDRGRDRDDFRRRRARLRVFCGNQLVFDDGAIRKRIDGFEFLFGLSGPGIGPFPGGPGGGGGIGGGIGGIGGGIGGGAPVALKFFRDGFDRDRDGDCDHDHSSCRGDLNNRDRDRDRDRAFVATSWLNVAGHVLEGFCAVNERHRDRHDHDSFDDDLLL